MNQTALDTINKCSDTKDTFLDLGRLGLRDEDFAPGGELDLALGRCMHVEKITFSDEWYEWKNDTIYKVDCKNNGVSNFFQTFPPSLLKLQKLTQLVFAGSYSKPWKINSMDFIKNFTLISHLDLSCNQITEIHGLDKCTNLITLELSFNRIWQVSGLGNCSLLQNLYLSKNQISETKELKKCICLVNLDLSDNQIPVIEGLQNCRNLKSLELSFNEISEIKGLEACSELSYLELSDNEITEIKGLNRLKNLLKLKLNNNLISRIENLNKLKSIEEINLSENPIVNLAELPYLTNLPNLKVLKLFGNEKNELNIPVELFGQSANDNCLEPLRGYFASLKKGSFQYNEVPIILVGNSTAGKTSLRYFLTQNVYPPPDNHSTHGIEPDLWVPDDETFENSGVVPKPENLQLYLWDFGGQEYYHATHRLFYSQRAIYILVWEKKTNLQSIEEIDIQIKHQDGSIEQTKLALELFPYEYWLQGIRYLTRSQDETPVILLQNKIDQTGNEEVAISNGQILNDHNCKALQISISRAYEISGQGKSDPRTSLLIQQIFKEANHLAMRTLRGQIWSDIKKMLQQVRDEKIWTPERFLEELKEFDPDIEENSMISFLLQLRALGYIFYEYEDPFLKNHIFINTGWVTEMIYSILDRTVLEANGEFDKNHIIEKVGEANAEIFIALMKRFELVFFNEELDVFIAPQYLPAELQEKRKRNELKAKFDYEQEQPALVLQFDSFMPRFIMLRCLVAFGEKAIGKYYWKNGIAFSIENSAVLLISDYKSKQFKLFVEDDDPSVQRLVFNRLEPLIENKKGLSLSVEGSAFLTYERLQEEFPFGKSLGNSVLKALDGSHMKVAAFNHLFGEEIQVHQRPTKPPQPEKKIFVSYAWGGESEKIVDDIDSSFALKGIKLIRDKRDLGFKGMITEFMKQIGVGDAIVTVISDKYLRSPYCMFELLEIYRNQEFEERVFPIVLIDAKIYNPIERLQYYKYWKGEKEELEAAIKDEVDTITMIGDDYKIYKKIFENIGEIVKVLSDINALNPALHSNENFETLISAIAKQLEDN